MTVLRDFASDLAGTPLDNAIMSDGPSRKEWLRLAADLLLVIGGENEGTLASLATCAEQVRYVRDRLVAMDVHMRACPSPLRSIYQAIPENDLAERAERRADDLENDGGQAFPPPIGRQAVVTALAVEIRAWDELLFRYNDRIGASLRTTNLEFASSCGRALVIPSLRHRNLGSRHGDAIPYGRRGTLRHRIVPAEMHGLSVSLVHVPRAADPKDKAVDAPLRLGGALFETVKLEVAYDGSAFVVTSAHIEEIDAVLEVQLAGLADCDMVVWPELTLDGTRLALLQRHLSRGRPGPIVSVAGSRHFVTKAGTVNRCSVLTSNGRIIAEHDKIIPYENENIVPGERVLVLVGDGFLASVAICKDFCELAESTPWPDLAVDFILVPSMGKLRTMEGHVDVATASNLRAGARAFVVQQQHTEGDEANDRFGWILHAPLDFYPGGVKLTAESLRTHAPATTVAT